MSALTTEIKILRFYQGTPNPMMSMVPDERIPEWCSLEIMPNLFVDYIHQTTCRILEYSIYVNYLSATLDGNLETLDFEGRLDTETHSSS